MSSVRSNPKQSYSPLEHFNLFEQSTPSTDSKESTTFKTSPLRRFGLVAIRFYNKTLLASWSCMQLNDYGNAEPPGNFQMTLKSSQPFSSFDNNSKHAYKNYTGPFE
ncbi:hypothetical protein PPACK8108_LOCUS19045 [Phakopsora pachyrhizi]|uniref:Uncharacterized protein n=1 Tax=Phakopsora pachyrhizi TaxID=170000 RepID=A0AAV0AX14_PHAPC|nr:hypothetical protein PPACK8108_LOCUS7793 [Phakopsora pachyrhizi]CAH7672950.1 hypothetical protein PPACK8108_LOCUS7794 [Phakopsora pachyrhizi]CAH7684668.1 hypothetical protein PPACK8108_LOCUS19045 [Phakopsora pachyrhizi]